MAHGKKSHDFYRFVGGSCHLGFDHVKQEYETKPRSIRESLDMTDLNQLEDSKYERLNDHIVRASKDKHVKFTQVRDTNANKQRVAEIRKKYLDAPIDLDSKVSTKKAWSRDRVQMAPFKALLNIWEKKNKVTGATV